jgi:FtsZ-binding cell division protein ZapB
MDGKLDQLVEALRREVEELRAENARLRQELEEAYRRIAELEQAAARQAAPFRRQEHRKVPPEQKKPPGSKPGHRGSCRMTPLQVDHETEVPLEACPRCGGPVRDKVPLVQYIEEIPPLRPEVTRLTTWSGVCACCGEVFSTHPLQTSRAQGAASVQLGPRALALAAMLNKQLGITMRGTCRVLREVCGLSITPGGLSQGLARVAGKMDSEYQALLGGLRNSPAVFVDETSWWVGGPGWWLWVFTTPQMTVYRVDASRGSQVVKETLGEDFRGMLVSDCLASYDPPDFRKHKCIAHHLRAIDQARDSPGEKSSAYLREWELFFQAVMLIYAMRPEWEEAFFVERRAALERWCDRLLAAPCGQPGEARVRNRLAKQRPHLLGCLYEPAAEPTNNRAERELRPAVIARKLSCGNKTPAGRKCWEVLASIARTCSRQAEDFVQFLATRLPLSPQAR